MRCIHCFTPRKSCSHQLSSKGNRHYCSGDYLSNFMKQECIPVGCILPTAVAIGGVCLSACWDTPPSWVWAWRPPWVWAWSPPGCGPGNLQDMLDTTPQDPLQGMLGYHLQCMLGYHPLPVKRITDTCKNITLPQLRCGR